MGVEVGGMSNFRNVWLQGHSLEHFPSGAQRQTTLFTQVAEESREQRL